MTSKTDIAIDDHKDLGTWYEPLMKVIHEIGGSFLSAEWNEGSMDKTELLEQHLKFASSDPFNYQVVANYYRPGIGMKGGGHFSPLTGLLTVEKQVNTIIMDTARYMYAPTVVTISNIMKAMATEDDAFLERGKRGWIFIRRKVLLKPEQRPHTEEQYFVRPS